MAEDNDWPDLFEDEIPVEAPVEELVEGDVDEDEVAIEGDVEVEVGGEEGEVEAAAEDGNWEVEEQAVSTTPGKYKGRICQVGAKTGNMLIQNRMLTEYYGGKEPMIVSAEYPNLKMNDLLSFDVVEREGQRPLATNVQVIPDEGKGKGKTKGKGKGKGKADPTTQVFHAGIVQTVADGATKGYITCERSKALYGVDAWFPVSEWPEGLSEGGSVVFTVRDDTEVGTAPRALNVARLSLAPSLLRQNGKGGAKGGKNGSKTNGVRKSITK